MEIKFTDTLVENKSDTVLIKIFARHTDVFFDVAILI